MGPNGAGKSTLSYVLTGRDGYDVTDGSVDLNGKDLLDMDPEERAAEGVFLSFQYPLEIPGVPTMTFLKTALNAQRKERGEEEMKAPEFLKKCKARDPNRGMLIITHYQRLLDYIVPDAVHVLTDGKIVASGDAEFAKTLEKEGYDAYAA